MINVLILAASIFLSPDPVGCTCLCDLYGDNWLQPIYDQNGNLVCPELYARLHEKMVSLTHSVKLCMRNCPQCPSKDGNEWYKSDCANDCMNLFDYHHQRDLMIVEYWQCVFGAMND